MLDRKKIQIHVYYQPFFSKKILPNEVLLLFVNIEKNTITQTLLVVVLLASGLQSWVKNWSLMQTTITQYT